MSVVRHLHRFAETDDGTIGRMSRWCTLEEEDQGNQRSISAIPVGEYHCVRVTSPTFGETFEITGVPGRSKILFHWGNTEEDTEGCVLLGMTFGALVVVDEDKRVATPKLAVLQSKLAFDQFMRDLDGVNEFKLLVTGP